MVCDARERFVALRADSGNCIPAMAEQRVGADQGRAARTTRSKYHAKRGSFMQCERHRLVSAFGVRLTAAH